jgi:hypothetical protein
MAIDLNTRDSLQANYFVRMDIPNYTVLRYSDYHRPFDIDGETYQNLGSLVSITSTDSNLRAAPKDITIQIAGIPESNVTDVLSNDFKGSPVKVYRALFDPVTGQLESGISPNPTGRFSGVISNFELSDDIDTGDDTGTLLLVFTCTSVVEVLGNKIAGRRTNPLDHKDFYPGDKSFDRVPRLAKSNFNFGAPK